ncbi:MAG: hypothetical protein KAU89_03310 [Candidatus Thorarchaeota archaeon]|jgi:multisubunit Na+/H+ antiporter MnhF subunit|nr:hypothetical protein [Candidatus Thorarchaeota archaeon]
MTSSVKTNRILLFLTSSLALIAAVIGVTNQSIYSLVVTPELLPGVIAQDVVTIIASVIALLLIIRIEKTSTSKNLIMLAIMGFLFYGYGMYVIERFYNMLYLVYMAIFSLSVYSIVFNAATIDRSWIDRIRIPTSIRIASATYLLINAIMFNIIWISHLLPLMQAGQKIEFIYSIYILDLCFIMPMFAFIGILAAKNKGLGLLVTPFLLILGFLILIPLPLGELLKPLLYGVPMDPAGMGLFLILSVIFFILAIVYLWKMEVTAES